jgi:hypothetical protein
VCSEKELRKIGFKIKHTTTMVRGRWWRKPKKILTVYEFYKWDGEDWIEIPVEHGVKVL